MHPCHNISCVAMLMRPSSVSDSDTSAVCWVPRWLLGQTSCFDLSSGGKKKKNRHKCKWFFSPAGKTTVSLTGEEEEEMKSAFLGSSEMRPVRVHAAIGPAFQTGRISEEEEESSSSPEIELDSSGSGLRSKPDALPATQLLVRARAHVCLPSHLKCVQTSARLQGRSFWDVELQIRIPC